MSRIKHLGFWINPSGVGRAVPSAPQIWRTFDRGARDRNVRLASAAYPNIAARAGT